MKEHTLHIYSTQDKTDAEMFYGNCRAVAFKELYLFNDGGDVHEERTRIVQ